MKGPRKMRRMLKSTIRALARSIFLAGSLLLSNTSSSAANSLPVGKASIRERVNLVREELKRKVADSDIAHNQLSYSEKSLAQWGNWGNWANWGNWNNWNNWRNWANWGNWGNR